MQVQNAGWLGLPAAALTCTFQHPEPAFDPPLAPPNPGLDPNSVESAPYLWHKGKDFVKSGTPVNLMYRWAQLAELSGGRRSLARSLLNLQHRQQRQQQQ